MVGWFIQQEDVWLCGQCLCERDAFFLATREAVDPQVRVEAESIDGALRCSVKPPSVRGFQLGLQCLHPFEQRVHVLGVWVGERVRDLMPLPQGRCCGPQPRYDGFKNRVFWIERGLLGDIGDLDPRLRPGLAVIKPSQPGEGA